MKKSIVSNIKRKWLKFIHYFISENYYKSAEISENRWAPASNHRLIPPAESDAAIDFLIFIKRGHLL